MKEDKKHKSIRVCFGFASSVRTGPLFECLANVLFGYEGTSIRDESEGEDGRKTRGIDGLEGYQVFRARALREHSGRGAVLELGVIFT